MVIYQVFIGLSIFLGLSVAGIPNRYGKGKIVGGENATIEDIPWQATLHYYSSIQCGGSIINKNTILTAAHCFQTFSQNPNAFKIRVGTDKRSAGDIKLLKVKNYTVHPDFNSTTFDNDIAIVKLEENLNFTSKVQPIEIANANDSLAVGEFGLTSGYGILGVKEGYPTILQKVELEILDQKICEDKYKKLNEVHENMFCAGGDGNKDACNGDSGGPFVLKNKLIGIVSYGIKCALPEYPGVFTRVSVLRQWVDENI